MGGTDGGGVMQTVINWIPGYPEDAQKHERWWVMLKGYDTPCIMPSDTAKKSELEYSLCDSNYQKSDQ